jgi:hypothetical protein
MSVDPRTELVSFQRFITECVVSGDPGLSPDEALDLWRAEHPSPSDRADTVAAVREALAAYEAGDRGMPLDEFDRQFRERHNLDP